MRIHRLILMLFMLLALTPVAALAEATFVVHEQDAESVRITCEIDARARTTLQRLVAVPEGASAEVEIVALESIPLAGAVAGPGEPARIAPAGQIRGVDVALLELEPVIQSADGVTHICRRVELRISFAGGTDRFGERRLRSRFFDPILRALLLNHDSLPPIEPRDSREDGYEYVIIAPDEPSFVAWGDSLAAWRNLQGIHSAVFTTAEIGQSSAEIEAWLDNAYNSWDIPPTAALLLGDYENSGDNPSVPAPIYAGFCVSDNMYADVDGDNLPDLVVSRIAAQNATDIAAMVGKQLAYERQPPDLPCFYAHPVVSGAWSNTGWSIFITETIRGYWEHVQGKAPVSEYVLQGEPPLVWPDEALAAYFGPSGLGYIPADPTYLTDWGGNAERINADINSGAFMVLYRGHGLEQGWGGPSYTIPDLSGLTNEDPPFVFSSACLTGKYNYAAPCFAEAFHRRMAGAIGLIAPSEILYSVPSDYFTWFVIDGIWQDFMPEYGDPSGAPLQHTAFANAYAKFMLAALPISANPQSKIVTYHLFHHFGDAFLALNSEVPTPLTVLHGPYLGAGLDRFPIQADEGALIGLTVDGEIIGVGEGTGMMEEIIIEPQTVGSELRITVTQVNHLRYDTTIPVMPASGAEEMRVQSGLRFSTARAASGAVEFTFTLPRATQTRLSIFDAEGRCVESLVDGMQTAGTHTVVWDGRGLAGGLYFGRLAAGEETLTKRVLLVD